jgi:hypothetical protein
VPVFAQAPGKAPGGPVVASVKPEAPQALTELEQAWLIILQLRTAYATLLSETDACRAQIGPLRARAASEALTQDEAGLKAKIEAGHPGYTWDPKTGAFTKQPPAAATPGKK